MPRSVSGRKTCNWPRDCSVSAAHNRNSKTCPDALSSSVLQGRVMRPDSRFLPKIKSPARDFPTQSSEEGKEVSVLSDGRLLSSGRAADLRAVPDSRGMSRRRREDYAKGYCDDRSQGHRGAWQQTFTCDQTHSLQHSQARLRRYMKAASEQFVTVQMR